MFDSICKPVTLTVWPRYKDNLLLYQTVLVYCAATKFAFETAVNMGISNDIRLHHQVYYPIRQIFKLPADLADTAIRRAAGALKRYGEYYQFKPDSIEYDMWVFSLFADDRLISLATIAGRVLALCDLTDEIIRKLRRDPATFAILRLNDSGWLVELYQNTYNFGKRLRDFYPNAPLKVNELTF